MNARQRQRLDALRAEAADLFDELLRCRTGAAPGDKAPFRYPADLIETARRALDKAAAYDERHAGRGR